MTNGPTREGLPRFAILFFVACFAVIAFFLYRVFAPFFTAMIWAMVLTIVFSPIFRRILRIVGGRRAAAAFITCLLVLILIVLPVTTIGVLITQQSIAFYQGVQANAGSLAEVAARLDEIQNRPAIQRLFQIAGKVFGSAEIDLKQLMHQAASGASRFLADKGPSVLRNVGEMIFRFFLIFITMFFLFRDGPKLIEAIKAANPLPDAIEAELFKKLEDVSYATFYGSILTAVTQGAAAGLLFWALGLPSPLFWGAVVSLVSLVPIVGAFLVWLPWSAYLLLAGHVGRGLLLLALGGLVVSSIDNVLKPLIIKGRTDMHPLLVFLSVLGGLQAFGFIGVLLGPLMVVLFISFLNFYEIEFHESFRHKKTAAGLQPPSSETAK